MIQLETLVPDKSISHRAAILAALSSHPVTVENYSMAEDCVCTANALAACGVDLSLADGILRVNGSGCLRAPSAPLDMGNSGTGFRLMMGVLAGQPFVSDMTGDESLCSRPMRRVAEPLTRMGARVEYLYREGVPPLRVHGVSPLRALEWRLEPASAQVKSAILLAALFADGETVIDEPVATRDHTERLLRGCGVDVRRDGERIRMRGGQRVMAPARFSVPGDFSAAAFFIVWGLLNKNFAIELSNIGLNPTRTAFLDAAREMGGDIQAEVTGEAMGEPVGRITVRPSELNGITVDSGRVPNMIDELPAFSLLAASARGRTVVSGAGELRVKESDRIKSIVSMVCGFSGAIDEREDGFEITGGKLLAARRRFETFKDHRIAMCIRIAASVLGESVELDDEACIKTSFPTFEDCMEAVDAQRHRA